MEILLHPLGLRGRQMKSIETYNDRKKPTHHMPGSRKLFLIQNMLPNTICPVETALNNECTDGRPCTETYFVQGPIILKINK